MPKPVIATVVLLLLAIGLLIIGVVAVTGQVNAASGDVHAVFGILAMPIVIGLKQAGHRRLEFGWGTLAIFVLPFLVGQLWAMVRIARR
jgi:hypothetical protein